MNIKVQCSCETRYSFEVEPVNGKMPTNIFCPTCGADGTDYANQFIHQSLGEAPSPVRVVITKPRIRLQVADDHTALASPPTSGESGEVALAEAEMCHRHTRNAATEHCVVCQKPICPECMQTFGYLCSVGCRYRAEQEKIRVPVYKFQRNVVERGDVRKSVGISVAVGLVVVALFGALFWYTLSGSKPRSYYILKVPPDKGGTYAQFLGPNQILLLNKNKIALHNIKSKKETWSTALDDPSPVAAGSSVSKSAAKKTAVDEDDDSAYAYEDYSTGPAPHFTGNDVWICLSHRVMCVDLASGSVKHNVPFKGRRVSFTPGESMLLVVSEKEPTKKIVTQISLTSGEAKTSEVAVAAREKVALSKDLPSTVLPTAALLMKYELDAAKAGQPSIYKSSSEFFPAGQNLVEMRVKLVEAKITTVQTMKKPGPSNLNSGTSASTSTRAVAEEIFNELKRNETGGFRQVDESRYGVTLHREMETSATDWSGEVKGLPVFFPMKTVDVLTGGKTLFIFDKQNKKIAEAQLTFPIADRF
ncbi:MAG: B-box zinc finger protein, partial [Verrucomicrobiota bacterium]